MSVRERDHGAKKITRRSGTTARLKVGIIGADASAEHQGGQATNVEIAAFHEFGLGVPERSIVRAWFDEKIAENKALLKRIPAAVVKGTSVQQAADQVALAMAGDMQERISEWIEPPNSPVTIARKGSSKPLIDTGQLRSSISGTAEVKGG